MRTSPSEKMRYSAKGRHSLPIVFVLACGMLCFVFPSSAQEKQDKEPEGDKGSKGAGIYFNAEACAKDVGLPVYPGARPHKEKENNSDSVKMGLWGGSFAFTLAVVKLESNDSPQKIAAFYKKPNGNGTVFQLVYVESPDSDKKK